VKTAAQVGANQADLATITLDDERPLSWNNLYSGKFHWSQRNAEANRVHLLVLAALDPDTVQMFTGPVAITVTVYFRNRPFDPDNICAKLYIDGLKDRIIEDDTPAQVASVTTVSKVDKERPRVEIEVRAA